MAGGGQRTPDPFAGQGFVGHPRPSRGSPPAILISIHFYKNVKGFRWPPSRSLDFSQIHEGVAIETPFRFT